MSLGWSCRSCCLCFILQYLTLSFSPTEAFRVSRPATSPFAVRKVLDSSLYAARNPIKPEKSVAAVRDVKRRQEEVQVVAFGLTETECNKASRAINDRKIFTEKVNIERGCSKLSDNLSQLWLNRGLEKQPRASATDTKRVDSNDNITVDSTVGGVKSKRAKKMSHSGNKERSSKISISSTDVKSDDRRPRVMMFLPKTNDVNKRAAGGAGGSRKNDVSMLSDKSLSELMEALDTCWTSLPLIVSIPTASEFEEWTNQKLSLDDIWRKTVSKHLDEYSIREPMKTHATDFLPTQVTPVMQVEMDGATVSSSSGTRWDASRMVVLDNFLDEDLRSDLMALITEKGWEGSSVPPSSKWEKVLVDVDGMQPTWGLKKEALEELLTSDHPAIIEVQSRLAKLYPDSLISRMPAAIFGSDTPSIVGNAPVNGDSFSWHIDADPKLFPPSPWVDVYGTYTNREPRKPVLVTLLLYLDKIWPNEWDAETLFLDNPTGMGLFVRPKAGRAILMDQDITHRVSVPSAVTRRPRYSLVWKLVFDDKNAFENRSTANSQTIFKSEWGEVTRFGSARGPPVSENALKEGSFAKVAKVKVNGVQQDQKSLKTSKDAAKDECLLESGTVVIASAGAKGKGAFAQRNIPANTYIGEYRGERLTREQLDARYPIGVRSEYVFEASPGNDKDGALYIDARDPSLSSWHRYINHSNAACNVIVEIEPAIAPSYPRIMLKTCGEITAGSELLLDYGDMYWGEISDYNTDEEPNEVEEEEYSSDEYNGEDDVIEELGDLLNGVQLMDGFSLTL